MGFFSDLKEDLAQAVNELTEDTAEKELQEEEERLKRELAAMENELQVSGVDEPEVSHEEEYAHYMAEEAVYEEESVEEEYEAEEVTEQAYDSVNEDVMAELSAGFASVTEEMEAENTEELFEADVLQLADDESDETVEETEEVEEIEEIEEVVDMIQEEVTAVPEIKEDTYVSMTDENAEVGIIPAGMMITGDITTGGALDLRGTVLGNIEIGGKLNVSGSIQGNSKAVEIFAQAAKITGDISCDNSVKIGPNSVVIGNISARSAVIAGAVKGDIDVRGPVILDSSAIIMGNIKSKSVQINNGAAIEGMCSQCYADVNPSSFFEGIEE